MGGYAVAAAWRCQRGPLRSRGGPTRCLVCAGPRRGHSRRLFLFDLWAVHGERVGPECLLQRQSARRVRQAVPDGTAWTDRPSVRPLRILSLTREAAEPEGFVSHNSQRDRSVVIGRVFV